MAQRSDETSPGTILLAADAVEVLDSHPDWQVRGTFVTDPDSSFLYLRRLTIEPSDENAEPRALTADVVRDVRIRGLQRLAATLLGARADVEPASPPSTGAKPGRKTDTWPDERLACLARDYAVACGLTRAPFNVLREQWPEQTDQSLRTAVKLARSRGYLTMTPTPGVAGGAVTHRTRELLRSLDYDAD